MRQLRDRLEATVQERRQASGTLFVRLRAREDALRLQIQEAEYRPQLHPRDRLGKWRKSHLTTLGVTPYLQRHDPGSPRASYAGAGRARSDLDRLMGEFEGDVHSLAKQHKVKLNRVERNVGVFEGIFEPSYAIDVTGDEAAVDAYNQALGAKYDQKAVVSFLADPDGSDVEVRLTGGADPDSFYRDLVKLMGEDAGASFDHDSWRVFVYGGDEQIARGLSDLADEHGMKMQAVPGQGKYHELRSGTG